VSAPFQEIKSVTPSSKAVEAWSQARTACFLEWQGGVVSLDIDLRHFRYFLAVIDARSPGPPNV
jgi:hypothetical protein